MDFWIPVAGGELVIRAELDPPQERREAQRALRDLKAAAAKRPPDGGAGSLVQAQIDLLERLLRVDR